MGHSISLANADIPERTYDSDVAGAIYEKDLVKLMFAQAKLGGGLRSLVIVSMTPIATAQFLQMMTQMSKPSIREIADGTNIQVEALTPFPDVEPDQTASLRANVVAAAFSGQDACFDFYQISPFAAAQLPTTSKLNLEAVVRVNTYTSLAVSLIEKLQEFAKVFPPLLGVKEKPSG